MNGDIKTATADKPGAKALAPAKGEVSFDHVSFKYGEGPQGVIPREVAATADHFSRLRHGAARKRDAGPDAPGVGASPVEAHGDARGSGVVAKEFHRGVHPVDDHVEVPVIVQIGHCHPTTAGS